MRCSSAETAWLRADGDIPSSLAAPRKLRCTATAATAISSDSAVFFIVRFPASTHTMLRTLSHQSSTVILSVRHPGSGKHHEQDYLDHRRVVGNRPSEHRALRATRLECHSDDASS